MAIYTTIFNSVTSLETLQNYYKKKDKSKKNIIKKKKQKNPPLKFPQCLPISDYKFKYPNIIKRKTSSAVLSKDNYLTNTCKPVEEPSNHPLGSGSKRKVEKVTATILIEIQPSITLTLTHKKSRCCDRLHTKVLGISILKEGDQLLMA